MFIKKYILLFLFVIGLFSCQEKQNTLEGLVDASAHEKEFYEKQVSFLDDVISKESEDASLFAKRGAVKLRQNNYAAVLNDLEQAITLDSTNGEYYFIEATAHYYLGNKIEAINLGRKSLELGFRHPQLKTFIGAAYTDMNQYDSALFFLKESLKDVPQNSKTYRALGNTYLLMGNTVASFQNYEKATQLNPLDSVSYAGMIEILIANKELEKATYYYNEATELSLSSSDINYAYGMLLNAQDSYDSAMIVFEEVLKVNPQHWKSSRQLGKLYRRSRKPLDANKVFLEGLKFDQTRKELWYELGLTNQYVLKNYAEARKNYEKALELDPTYQDAKYALNNLKATLRKLYAPPKVDDINEETSEETQL